jgi:hypothetical protein
MRSKRMLTYLLLFLVICCLGLTILSNPSERTDSKSMSIEGTYKLLYRKLPNGIMIKPPVIVGMETFTKNYRNFNVMWTDSAGSHFSYSIISKYKLTDKDYTETLLFSLMNDESGIINKGLHYVSGQTKSSPVKMDGSKIIVKFPFDSPTLTFDGNKMTAAAEGMFTDYWEKVQ